MVCPPLCGIECRVHAQYPVFAPGSSEMAVLVGGGEGCLFVSFCAEFAPGAQAHSYF